MAQIILRNILLFLFTFYCHDLHAQVNEALEDLMINFSKEEKLKHAFISASIVDIHSGVQIGELNSEKSLIPASSLKLITNLIALDRLGPEFQFLTTLGYNGNISKDGSLAGDLYLRGGGDPSFASKNLGHGIDLAETLRMWIRAIRQSGIYCINGKLIIDVSIFDNIPVSPSWQWNDVGNYYASGVWGLNLNENLYQIAFEQKNLIGATPVLLGIEPNIPGLQFVNELKTGPKNSGDRAYIFGGPYNDLKRIRGTIPAGRGIFVIKGSIPDPPRLAGELMIRQLAEQGIQCSGYEINYKKGNFNTPQMGLLEIKSPVLSELVKAANFESNNLISEALIKTMGLEYNKTGSLHAGICYINEYLANNNMDTLGLHLEDGSGLSTRNRISAGFMSSFLQHIWSNKMGNIVLNYIPKAGVEGTVRNIHLPRRVRGNVWAKSGSMNGVISYSGFVNTRTDRWVSFCLIINGFENKLSEIRQLIDEYLTGIYELG